MESLIISSWEWQSRLTTQLHLSVGLGWVAFFLRGQSNVLASAIWKFFTLLSCPCLVFGLETAGILSLYLLLFPGCQLLQCQSKGHISQKENPGNSPHIISWILRSLVFMPFLHLSESSYVYIIYNVHDFQLFYGRNRAMYIYSIFLKAEVPTFLTGSYYIQPHKFLEKWGQILWKRFFFIWCLYNWTNMGHSGIQISYWLNQPYENNVQITY